MRKIYKTSELYVAKIGPVKFNYLDEGISFRRNGIFISIVTKSNDFGDYFCIIDDKEYKYFDNVSYNDLSKNLDKYYIKKLIPLNVFLKVNRDISIDEIIALYNKLNKMKTIKTIPETVMVEEPKKINDSDVKDSFLNLILKTKDKICEDMKDEVKEKFIEELVSLGNFYANKLTVLIEENKLDDRYRLMSECMPTLVDIEFRIMDYNKRGVPRDNFNIDFAKFNTRLK